MPVKLYMLVLLSFCLVSMVCRSTTSLSCNLLCLIHTKVQVYGNSAYTCMPISYTWIYPGDELCSKKTDRTSIHYPGSFTDSHTGVTSEQFFQKSLLYHPTPLTTNSSTNRSQGRLADLALLLVCPSRETAADLITNCSQIPKVTLLKKNIGERYQS